MSGLLKAKDMHLYLALGEVAHILGKAASARRIELKELEEYLASEKYLASVASYDNYDEGEHHAELIDDIERAEDLHQLVKALSQAMMRDDRYSKVTVQEIMDLVL